MNSATLLFADSVLETLKSLLPLVYGAIGGLVAAYAASRFQRNNWLFQRKLEVYAKLIETLETSRDKIFAYYYDECLSQKELSDRVRKDFLPVKIQERIARFFASEDTIEEMSKILVGFEMAFSGSTPNFEKYMMSMYFFTELKRLQEILELDTKYKSRFARWRYFRGVRKRFEEDHRKFIEKSKGKSA
jgi:hypothetical protein